MENLITIDEALKLENVLFIDVRSPKEYLEAHIPGAYNLPLFDDEERSLIGTIYKAQSPEEAVEKGFELIAPKLPSLTQKLKELSRNKKIILYCWRGGMRSKSLCHLLNILGRKGHFRLIGGYKAFRHLVNDFFAKPPRQEIVVLHGLTGVGKTQLLQELREEGKPAIDLEALAHNRGSVFGHIGMSKGPSQKQFEGNLYMELYVLRDFARVIVECESRRVGNVIIPETFFQAMQKGRKVLLFDSMENRVARLIATYHPANTAENDKQIMDSLHNLKNRLSNVQLNKLSSYLIQREYDLFVLTLLKDYYDPLYHYPHESSGDFELNLDGGDWSLAKARLGQLLVSK